MMLILFFLVLMGILFAIALYVYENSPFSRLTGNSFSTIWTDQEIRFLYRVSQKLKKINGQYEVLFNIAFPHSDRKIDALLILRSGLYIIEAKRMRGWIYGKETDVQWAEALERGGMTKFQNPVVESKLEIMRLKDHLPEVSKELFHSLIVFNDQCSFKNIEIHSSDVDVIKLNELPEYFSNIGHIKDDLLTTEEMKGIANTLKPFMEKNPKEKASVNNVTSL
ncbi:NERD domain-containing protein [Lysinibacillus yapensis]|uniref:NERD domain-containing protein n=1 Tax=Ureibacillus yapensis TaxID=2304605 RepID=A0A396SKE9_9BACL|nr:nuclease-related domain-containing protein [Lysinibacillus yapensis]RHW34950.1 NERD domain-containing protein [Lysinibacillus yapensis]